MRPVRRAWQISCMRPPSAVRFPRGCPGASLKLESEKESENRSEKQLSSGAPEEIRTPNLLIRSQMLYPIELRARPCGGPGKNGAAEAAIVPP